MSLELSLFLMYCTMLTNESKWCKENTPIFKEESTIERCPLAVKTDCLGVTTKDTREIFLSTQLLKGSVLYKSVFLHEVCHYLDFNGKDCRCDPYELQRRYLFNRGKYFLYFLYRDMHHDQTRKCTSYDYILFRRTPH